MTIAQRFAELGQNMGIDMSNCHTGNVGEVLNMITQGKGGTVSDSQNIQLAMMNLTDAMKVSGSPLPPDGWSDAS